MKPRITYCRRNLSLRHRRLRRSAQAAASAAVGSWRVAFASATFKDRFRISSSPHSLVKVPVARRDPGTDFDRTGPFFCAASRASPLSTNVERGTGGEDKTWRGGQGVRTKRGEGDRGSGQN